MTISRERFNRRPPPSQYSGGWTRDEFAAVQRAIPHDPDRTFYVTDPRFKGAVGDGVRDDTDAFLTVLDKAPAGSVILVPPPSSYYKISDTLPLTKAVTIAALWGRPEIRQGVNGKGAFLVSASNVRIRSLTLTGPQATREEVLESAVSASGASSAAYLDGLWVEDCALATWSYGVYAKFVQKLRVTGSDLSTLYYAGVLGASVQDFEIDKNHIDGVSGTPNAYGIAMTRVASGSTVTDPPSRRGKIHDNDVRNVTNWEAIDTHGGQDIDIYDNTGDNNGLGVQITYTSDGVSPERVRAKRNTFTAGANTLHQSGGEINGYSAAAPAIDCELSNNTFTGYGADTDEYAAIRAQNAERPVLHHNTLYDSISGGICLLGDVVDAQVTANHIVGLTASVSANVGGIKVPSGYTVSGFIDGNTGDVGANPAIRVGGAQNIRLGVNTIRTTGTEIYPDAESYRIRQLSRGNFRDTNRSTSWTPDVNRYESSYLTLTGNIGIGAPTGDVRNGDRLTFIFRQDGTGGRTVSWNAVFKTTWSDAGNTASKCSSIEFENDGGGTWVQRSYTPWF